ncbi:hypothetical protein NQ314_017818 [Rhamnusium bicolor]|uniref:Integrase catalytic domain-containing protein n=1 Tax=Rhamnusium bicolor TaxID=1586634 RepID=A0AAV8WUS3_9CUCU|nr:hypothetical protein NQ314_017818 [Rhamnusium bicolor]
MEAVKDTTSKHVISCLKLLIKFCGNPTRIITDRGKGFANKELNAFCTSENIQHVLNAVASPRSNGQVERFNRTILTSLTTAIGEDHGSWEQKICKVQRGIINMCLNSTTGKSPSELLYGFRPRLKYDIELSNILADSDRLKTFDKNRNKALGKINKTAKAEETL